MSYARRIFTCHLFILGECFDADDDNGRICGSITPDTVLYTLFRGKKEETIYITCRLQSMLINRRERERIFRLCMRDRIGKECSDNPLSGEQRRDIDRHDIYREQMNVH